MSKWDGTAKHRYRLEAQSMIEVEAESMAEAVAMIRDVVERFDGRVLRDVNPNTVERLPHYLHPYDDVTFAGAA